MGPTRRDALLGIHLASKVSALLESLQRLQLAAAAALEDATSIAAAPAVGATDSRPHKKGPLQRIAIGCVVATAWLSPPPALPLLLHCAGSEL